MGTLKVNFSEQEAASEGRSFEPIPSGEYHVKFFEAEDAESKTEKNYGKPYWKLTCVIQDGDFEDRRLWTNVMLFEGALYTISQMMKAAGLEDMLKLGEIPDFDHFVGKDAVAIVAKVRDKYKEDPDNGGDGTPMWKNEIKGFKKYEGPGTVSSPKKTTAANKKAASLLP